MVDFLTAMLVRASNWVPARHGEINDVSSNALTSIAQNFLKFLDLPFWPSAGYLLRAFLWLAVVNLLACSSVNPESIRWTAGAGEGEFALVLDGERYQLQSDPVGYLQTMLKSDLSEIATLTPPALRFSRRAIVNPETSAVTTATVGGWRSRFPTIATSAETNAVPRELLRLEASTEVEGQLFLVVVETEARATVGRSGGFARELATLIDAAGEQLLSAIKAKTEEHW